METPALFDLSDRAIARLHEVAARESVDLNAQFLRVAVIPGGCSGLTYDLGWDSALGETDAVVEVGGLRLALDLKSRLYVEGTTLDFSDGIDGKGFHFENPQAVRTCACGESFSL
jgi:iron-sulfur cluster assembly protein